MKQGYNLELLEKRIGYCFQDKLLLKQAITHSSYTNEQKINKYGHYERLEFLGLGEMDYLKELDKDIRIL